MARAFKIFFQISFCFGLSFVLFFVPTADAKTLRSLWIPQPLIPEEKSCRLELDQQYGFMKKAEDIPGTRNELGVAGSCNELRWKKWDVETSVDYRESGDVRTVNPWDPLQFSAKVTYGNRSSEAMRVALGVDGVGIKRGENDFNIVYLVGHSRAGDEWELSLGGFSSMSGRLGTLGAAKDNAGVLAGVWRTGTVASYGLEWWGGRHRYGYIFLGAKTRFRDLIDMSFGYGIANDRATMRDYLLIRLSLD